MKSTRIRDRLSPRSYLGRTVNTCRKTREWFTAALCHHLGPDAPWVRNHALACPRCGKRLAALRNVELALSLVRSQPHSLDLLSRANAQTIRMLEHDLRDAPKARELERSQPEVSVFERFRQCRHQVVHVAACVAIALMARAGVFASLDKARTGGQKVVRQYYADQVGDDLAREVFDG